MNGIVGYPREDDSVGVRQCLATVGMLTRAAVGYGSCLALCRWIYARGSFLCSGSSGWKEMGNCSSIAEACVCVSVPKQLSLSITSVCVACNYPTATGQFVAVHVDVW